MCTCGCRWVVPLTDDSIRANQEWASARSGMWTRPGSIFEPGQMQEQQQRHTGGWGTCQSEQKRRLAALSVGLFCSWRILIFSRSSRCSRCCAMRPGTPRVWKGRVDGRADGTGSPPRCLAWKGFVPVRSLPNQGPQDPGNVVDELKIRPQ